MKRRLLVAGGAAATVALAVGIAFGLWSAQSPIHVALEVSNPPMVAINYSLCDDDTIIAQATWEGDDSGPDPAGIGPMAPRYDKDIASCTTSFSGSEGTLTILAGYADLFTTAWYSIGNPGQAWELTAVVMDGVNLDDCPTMTAADIDGDTNLDVEACVGHMDGTPVVLHPVLGVIWDSEGSHHVMVGLHVLDSVTPGLTHVFDVTFVGETQTGGPE